ncbi:MAG: ATP-binding domain-containing protein, partial [Burkholderiales bacterium]
LYRSNAQSRVLEHALFSAGIAYRVYGGLRFFERAEVKHALAYLRLLENPADDTAFLRVVNFPTRGIGARTLEQLQDTARARGCSLWAAVGELTGAVAAKVASFVRIVQSMRQATHALSLPETVEHVIEASGLIAHYRSERDGQDRIENLRELVNAAATFLADEGVAQDTPANVGLADADARERAGREPPAAVTIVEPAPGAAPRETPLAAFLAHASLEAGDNQAAEGADALQLMTVHSAKGLEFDVVFVTGLEEGLFPHENSITEVDGLEEERRLMYVALTRARNRLYLSLAQSRMLHGQTRYSLKSRFLDELPEPCLKWLTPRAGGHAGMRDAWSDAWGGAWDGAAGGTRGANRVAGRAGPGRGGAFGGHGGAGGQGGAARQGLRAGAGPAGRATDAPFRVGQAVAHPKFGEGVVVGIEGSGADARVQVNFGAAGMKWLALAVARLEPVH